MVDNGPKRHHYVPAGYLAAFAIPPKRSGRLWAADLQSGPRVFPTTPNDAGKQRAYYRVDAPGVDPNLIENELAKIEDRALPLIRRASDSGQIADEEELEFVVGFLALLAVRGPRLRARHSEMMTSVALHLARISASSEEVFAASKADMIQRGFDASELTRSDLQKFSASLADGTVTVEQDRTTLALEQLRLAAKLMHVLKFRKWQVRRLADGASNLICSDHPVVLRPTRHGAGPLGFGVPWAEVLMPLSPRAVLSGLLGEQPVAEPLQEQDVRRLNRVIASCCTRWVYSASSDFDWLSGGCR